LAISHLVLEGRVLGLLRSEACKGGSAKLVEATAALLHDSAALVALNFPRK
jgi:hypothetical protein